MVVGKILPNAPAFEGVFAFFIEEGDAGAFPPRCGETLLVDPGARARYWLETIIRRPGSPGGLENPDARPFVENKIARGSGFVHGNPAGPVAVLPIHPGLTLLSRHYRRNRAVVNSHFFLMELGDLGSPWDCLGEPFGLLVIDGEVIQPPLFRRGALCLSEGGGFAAHPGIEDWDVELDGHVYRRGRNAEYFSRPEWAFTPPGAGQDVVIVNRRILACSPAGGTAVPSGGFVCRIASPPEKGTVSVGFAGQHTMDFAVQAGPLLIENGAAKTGFASPFYRGRGPAFPPVAFPLDWHRDRAARTAIGIGDDGPVLLAVEGRKGAGPEVAGASLAEMARIGVEWGLRTMVNLDGGGSAQMSVNGKGCSRPSDGFERPVPAGLCFDL